MFFSRGWRIKGAVGCGGQLGTNPRSVAAGSALVNPSEARLPIARRDLKRSRRNQWDRMASGRLDRDREPSGGNARTTK